MKKQEKIAHKIQEALASVDGIGRAEVKPFFFTRLEARLQNELQPSYGRFAFLANMKLNLAMLIIVFMFNVASVIFLSKENSNDIVDKSSLELFTEEYSSVTNTYDNLNEN
jgi:hypothetical protein